LNTLDMNTRILIASDHAGYDMKSYIIDSISHTYRIIDHGTHSTDSVNYTDIVRSFAKTIKDMLSDGNMITYGVLICGSGIGMSIAANRYHFIRAALCHTVESAILSRGHNDANVLCLGARLIDTTSGLQIIKSFIETKCDNGRHSTRIEQLSTLGYEQMDTE